MFILGKFVCVKGSLKTTNTDHKYFPSLQVLK